MSSEGSNQSPNEDLSGWGRLVHLDPVLLAALVTVVTGVAALFGVELTDGKAHLIAVVVLAVVVLGAQLWARRKTLARRKVLAYLPDPVDRPRAIAAGPATVTGVTDARIVAAVRNQAW
jgi:uncharacterized membrane protein YqjE